MPFLRTLFLLLLLIPFALPAQDRPVAKLTEEVWNYTTESWDFDKEWRYSFNADMQKAGEKYFTWNADTIDWKGERESRYFYDEIGRLIVIERKSWSDHFQSWSDFSPYEERAYDDNGCLVKLLGHQRDQDYFYTSHAGKKIFTVDANCNIVTILHYQHSFDQQIFLDSVFSIANLDSLRRYNVDDGQMTYWGTQYLATNEAGQWIEKKEIPYSFDVRNFPDHVGRWKNYDYNEFGDLSYYSEFDGRKGSMCRSTFASEYELFYDEDNRLVRRDEYRILSRNERRIFYRTMYEYYPCGELVRQETRYGMISGDPIPRKRTTYAYLNPVECNEMEAEVLLIPNPISHGNIVEVKSELLFADDAQLYVFDTAGKLLRQKAVPEYTAQVNLKTSWDWQGLFFVLIESNLGKATGKLTVF